MRIVSSAARSSLALTGVASATPGCSALKRFAAELLLFRNT
jgi:hypothetical protein